MTYELSAVIARAPLIEEIAGRFRNATAVPLNQGLALIPAYGGWLREAGWPADASRPYSVFGCLSRGLAEFLREASVRGPVGYVEIDEQQDRTWQAAVAWSGGEFVLPPRVLRPGEGRPPGGGPVVEAFAVLGARGELGQDPWASFGLYRFSHTQQWLEVPGLIQQLPEMELTWGQPGEDWTDFDFNTDYTIELSGHLFRLRVGTTQAGARHTVTFWRRTVLELDQIPDGWRLRRRWHTSPPSG